ncbi:unnamed protein product [Bursaphelenchus xylophilus]|uniref:(pine wood nematode) hypothetical protein n=1 Tax=Bursaphelenchus xylophilus TaxID=6326 RepID=A0A1I7RWR4_BURXY|nr:unnamed protein product [Bursaphelenchus xylophilus]CAG9128603.1 unnamed protein product [Bursaphelenchus xylophilus]
MKLRLLNEDAEATDSTPVVGVGWLNNETALYIGDDKRLMQWSTENSQGQEVANYNSTSYPIQMDVLHRQVNTGAKANTAELILIATSDGKVQHVNGNTSKIDKIIDAHEGATLCVKWSHDGTGFLSTGEDGALKTWSRSGMLRSVLTQVGRPIYAADWNGDGSRVVYTLGDNCVIMSLKNQAQPTKWKAHEGIVLCVAWSKAVDLIVSGGEDNRYRVFDSFGRPLYTSNPHNYPITALAWNSDGELFAVGSFNVLRLCDRAGWSHSVERRPVGSIYQLSWSLDGTQLAAAGASGQILVGTVVDRRLWWHNLEAVQVENRRIDLRDVMSEVAKEKLEVKNRVTRLQLGYGQLVVSTTKQLYIFSAKNWNTPIISELKDGNVTLILLCEKFFMLVDGGLAQVLNYEGRQQCTLRQNNGINMADHLTDRTAAISNDVCALKDKQNPNVLHLYETKTGKTAGDGRIAHSVEIVEVALNQCGPLSERRIAFVDVNSDCFLGKINSYGALRRYEKLDTAISNIHFNNLTNMLAAFRDRRVICFSLPSIVFTDRELLSRTCVTVESEDMGRSAFVVGFIGNGVTVRRSDGSLVIAYVPPFLSGIYKCFAKNEWDKALRMCRTVKEDYLWATLAGAAAMNQNYRIAEIAYSELLEVEKVYYLGEISAETKKERRNAAMALFNGNLRDAEAALIQAGEFFRAIMLNLSMFKFERALELAVKHNIHVDTVLGYRKRYLEETGRKENDQKFLKHYANYEIDWQHIREQVKHDLAKN